MMENEQKEFNQDYIAESQLKKLCDSVTIIIKTFGGPDLLNELIESIKKYYPDIKILVADDSEKPVIRDDVAGYYVLPFDSGLSRGRNFLLDKVKTKYFLSLDDDFVFTEETKIEKLMEVLDNTKIDLVGGEVLETTELPGLKKEGDKYKRAFYGLFEVKRDKLIIKRGYNRGTLDGYKLYDYVVNFFMAKTDKIRRIRWDDGLKIMEHEDFFLRCKGKINITHLDKVKVDHVRVRHKDYWKYREKRAREFVKKFKEKHKIKDIYGKFGLLPNYGEASRGLVPTKIPLNFFYYWSGQYFLYVYYLSVLSLLKTNYVNKIEIYYEEEPLNNVNWEMLKNLAKVKLVKVNYDTLFNRCGLKKEDFVDFFTKAKMNHRSDLIRYLLLYAEGGVYLDFDTLILKDLSDLLDVPFFAARENPEGVKSAPFTHIIVNGAVLGSCKKSETIKKFFDEIKKISATKESFHWVETGPGLLSRLYEKENFIAYPRKYFYNYYWRFNQRRQIFKNNDIDDDQVYIIHYWANKSKKYIKKIDNEYIKNSKALYAKLARRILDHNDQHLWDWKKSKWLLYERKLYEKIKPILNGRMGSVLLPPLKRGRDIIRGFLQ